jgi:probable phosphoglycerate mutase
MQILFVRHGNTFDPGDKVVWVGGETDLPLVDKGGAQAQAVAEALRRCNLVPDRIFAASLQRTRRTADIIAAELGLPPPIVDERQRRDRGRGSGRPGGHGGMEQP